MCSRAREPGASFLADVARAIHRLPNEVEDALWELVASGLVTGDGIAGLRTLLLPEEKRQARHHLRVLPGRSRRRQMPVGRWALLRSEPEKDPAAGAAADLAARRLLRRYGILVRELCARERSAPPWRELLSALRRMEARGEVRGGRFVDGLVGEQFALPEAVELVRAIRRRQGEGETVIVSAADPLNLVGTVLPGGRVSPYSGQVIAYRDGVPVEVGDLGRVRSNLARAGAAPSPVRAGRTRSTGGLPRPGALPRSRGWSPAPTLRRSPRPRRGARSGARAADRWRHSIRDAKARVFLARRSLESGAERAVSHERGCLREDPAHGPVLDHAHLRGAVELFRGNQQQNREHLDVAPRVGVADAGAISASSFPAAVRSRRSTSGFTKRLPGVLFRGARRGRGRGCRSGTSWRARG